MFIYVTAQGRTMRLIVPDLDPLFAPDSVAIVGASPDATYASRLVDNLLEYGFDGDLALVNPNREEAWDRPCYDDVTDVPGTPDLVVVSIPREHVVDVVETAGERGVPAALVISAGFSEADERGERLESELARISDETGIRVCGPNCIGVADMRAGTVLTSTCTRRPEPGRIGLVSQSGALAFTTFYERGTDESIPFAAIASTGNEADLTLADHVGYMTDRDDVDVICAYVEGVDAPRRFMSAAERAVREGTSVLVVKVGRSDVAEAATLSHTGSLTGNDAAWDAAFEQVGVERVPDIPDLLGRASAHAEFDPPASNRVCIASTSGGLASLLADLADERDLRLPGLPEATEAELLDLEALLTFGGLNNPVDIRGYGASALREIAESLFDADAYDAYVFAIGLSAVDERADRIADDLVAIAEAAPTPVAFLWTGRKEPEGAVEDTLPYERVRAEFPLFYDPARCLDAVGSLVRAGEAHRRVADRPTREERRSNADNGSASGGSVASAADGEGSPDGDGDPTALPSGRVLTWREASALLGAYGIDTVRTRVADGADEAADLAASIGFPVAMKVDSRDVYHRSDVGGVRATVSDRKEARNAYEEIVANVHGTHPDARIEGVLVQERVADGIEALVGVSADETFGSLLTVGPGGTLVETVDDGAIRIPPVSAAEVTSMVDETALGELLSGVRGVDPVDRTAFATLVRTVGDLAVDASVAELDLNPVVVHSDGAAVIDALVRTED